jgi:Ca2+-binding EF-hand superfamily protein
MTLLGDWVVRWLGGFALAACLGLCVAQANHLTTQTPNKRADPGSAEDVQDVLFLSDSRPMLIRLHIRVNGKPYGVRWTEHVTRWFHFLDRDDDGSLDRTEAARAPSAWMLRQMLANPYAFMAGENPSFEDFDRDLDSKVSLAEFLRYYRQSSAGPVQVAAAFNGFVPGIPHDTVTSMLFAVLDADKDGKLSQAELAVAEKVLHKYDLDDDERITVGELVPEGPASPGNRTQLRMVPSMQAPALPLLLVPREDAARRIDARLRIAKEVLARYDKNKNGTLGRDEAGMTKALFDRLDANDDDELDTFELLRWVIVTPDAEGLLRLGRVEDKLDAAEVRSGSKTALRKTASNALAFSTDDCCIHLVPAPALPTPADQSIRQILIQQFKTVDRAGKGYLTEKQVQTQQFIQLRSILLVADRDGDDCLTLEELNGWLDLAVSGINCQTTVALASGGRGLFQLLDANQDGQLSLRELGNVWSRLAPFDRNRDGCVSPNEVPLQYQIVVNPGGPNYAAGQPGGMAQPGRPAVVAVPARGPLWFRKMDRNGDGDLSPREFLGTAEDFRRLDTDGDGLISVAEALRADAALRKK